MRRRTPSIQPKHSASSTDSGQDMLGSPQPALRKPTSSSADDEALTSSQLRKKAASSKNVGVVIGGECAAYRWSKAGSTLRPKRRGSTTRLRIAR